MVNSSTRLALALIVAALQARAVFAADHRSVPAVKLPSAQVGGPEIKSGGLRLEGLAATPAGTAGMRIVRVAEAHQGAAQLPSAEAAIFHAVQVHPLAAAPIATPAQMGAGVTALAEQLADIHRSLEQDASGSAAGRGLDQIYFGKSRHGQGQPVQAGGGQGQKGKKGDAAGGAVFIVNDEGVEISGRAAVYYAESKRLEAKYAGQIDMSESLDVMDDSYADVYAKLRLFEAAAERDQVSNENAHLDETLIFLDGVVQHGRQRVAVNSHRVYFHAAPQGPGKADSEINEGIRRVDGYLKEVAPYFKRGGKAEQVVGATDKVVLGFDARGYDAIKDHIVSRRAEVEKTIGKPVEFIFLDDLRRSSARPTKEQVRAELNTLVRKYKGKGLQKIIEGVVYSRYVGLLLELKTMEHYHNAGYKILQGGRELFDAKGHYITELDVVVQAPDGRILVVEAKSARVVIPVEKALQDKVLYKIDTYIKHRADMERAIGGPMAEIVFSFDVGRNEALREYLLEQQEALSKRYGLPISFMFIDSGPEKTGDGRGGQNRGNDGGSGRKHGKKGRGRR